MGTPYSVIFGRALFRLTDTKLAQLTEAEQQYILKQYMNSAIADFELKCQTYDLSKRDDVTGEFDEVLDNEVIEILATGISYYWLSAQIMNRELLRNKLSTKDYTYFSPANLMRELSSLRSKVRTEYKHLITHYTYNHGDLTLENMGG